MLTADWQSIDSANLFLSLCIYVSVETQQPLRNYSSTQEHSGHPCTDLFQFCVTYLYHFAYTLLFFIVLRSRLTLIHVLVLRSLFYIFGQLDFNDLLHNFIFIEAKWKPIIVLQICVPFRNMGSNKLPSKYYIFLVIPFQYNDKSFFDLEKSGNTSKNNNKLWMNKTKKKHYCTHAENMNQKKIEKVFHVASYRLRY